MNNKLTARDRKHLEIIKNMRCSVCGEPGPSEAHHIEQGLQFLCIPLCPSCHRSSFNGIHGQARIWKVLKKTELTCLDETVKGLLDGMV